MISTSSDVKIIKPDGSVTYQKPYTLREVIEINNKAASAGNHMFFEDKKKSS